MTTRRLPQLAVNALVRAALTPGTWRTKDALVAAVDPAGQRSGVAAQVTRALVEMRKGGADIEEGAEPGSGEGRWRVTPVLGIRPATGEDIADADRRYGGAASAFLSGEPIQMVAARASGSALVFVAEDDGSAGEATGCEQTSAHRRILAGLLVKCGAVDHGELPRVSRKGARTG